MVLMRRRPSSINRWPTWTLFLEILGKIAQPQPDWPDGSSGRNLELHDISAHRVWLSWV